MGWKRVAAETSELPSRSRQATKKIEDTIIAAVGSKYFIADSASLEKATVFVVAIRDRAFVLWGRGQPNLF